MRVVKIVIFSGFSYIYLGIFYLIGNIYVVIYNDGFLSNFIGEFRCWIVRCISSKVGCIDNGRDS